MSNQNTNTTNNGNVNQRLDQLEQQIQMLVQTLQNQSAQVSQPSATDQLLLQLVQQQLQQNQQLKQQNKAKKKKKKAKKKNKQYKKSWIRSLMNGRIPFSMTHEEVVDYVDYLYNNGNIDHKGQFMNWLYRKDKQEPEVTEEKKVNKPQFTEKQLNMILTGKRPYGWSNKRVKKACKYLEKNDFIDDWEDLYTHIVGEVKIKPVEYQPPVYKGNRKVEKVRPEKIEVIENPRPVKEVSSTPKKVEEPDYDNMGFAENFKAGLGVGAGITAGVVTVSAIAAGIGKLFADDDIDIE